MNLTRNAEAFLLSGRAQTGRQRAQLCARGSQLLLCLLPFRNVLGNPGHAIHVPGMLHESERSGLESTARSRLAG